MFSSTNTSAFSNLCLKHEFWLWIFKPNVYHEQTWNFTLWYDSKYWFEIQGLELSTLFRLCMLTSKSVFISKSSRYYYFKHRLWDQIFTQGSWDEIEQLNFLKPLKTFVNIKRVIIHQFLHEDQISNNDKRKLPTFKHKAIQIPTACYQASFIYDQMSNNVKTELPTFKHKAIQMPIACHQGSFIYDLYYVLRIICILYLNLHYALFKVFELKIQASKTRSL